MAAEASDPPDSRDPAPPRTAPLSGTEATRSGAVDPAPEPGPTPEPTPEPGLTSGTELASGPAGMRLLAFLRLPEDAPPTDHPLTYVLVVVRHRDLLLMVRERKRDSWELPGGGIDPGETARVAAVRELWEESGLRLPAEALRFTGYARTVLRDHGTRYGAVYATELAEVPTGFTPNAEISMIRWWNGTDPFPNGTLQTTDSYLARLVAPPAE